MNKAMQSIDTAISTSGALPKGAGRCAQQDEPGAFSRLLSAGQTQTVQRNEARIVRESGNSLPDEQRQDSAGRAADRREDTAPAGLDSGQVAAQQQPDDAMPVDLLPAGTADLSVQLPGEAPEELLNTLYPETIGQAVATTETTGPDRPEMATIEPAAPATVQAPVVALQAETAPDTAALATAVTATAAPQAPVSALPAGRVEPDNKRGHASADPVGLAVRESVMQMLAARTEQGNSGDALASGGNKQAASFEQPATAQGAAAGILSFNDLLLGTDTSSPSARVSVPVGQPGWGRAVGEQVVWFVSQNIQSASLKLNPQHLGPLEMQLHMDGDKASIAFSSQHAAVREALESSLPRLRDLLAEQGLNLVNVNVSQHGAGSRREQAAAGNNSNGAAGRMANAEERLPLTAGLPGSAMARGLVDYYV